jgi:Domain of unknown function (DUF4157)
MRVRRGDGYWVWVGGPVPPGAAAITLGSVVIVRKRSEGNARLLRHEAVHVGQWRRFGVAGFLARYLVAYLKARGGGYPHWAAYRRIPFEIEAEWVSRRSAPSSGGEPPVG